MNNACELLEIRATAAIERRASIIGLASQPVRDGENDDWLVHLFPTLEDKSTLRTRTWLLSVTSSKANIPLYTFRVPCREFRPRLPRPKSMRVENDRVYWSAKNLSRDRPTK